MRLRFRRARFRVGCDIQPGFRLVLGPDARLVIGRRCIINRDMTIECRDTLEIGERTIFGHYCTLGVVDSPVIGLDCLIAEIIATRDHRFDGPLGVPVREQGMVQAPVKIGRNVWLAGKVTVLKGVTVGDKAVVGASAVVTKDIPANAVAAGMPERVLRTRS